MSAEIKEIILKTITISSLPLAFCSPYARKGKRTSSDERQSMSARPPPRPSSRPLRGFALSLPRPLRFPPPPRAPPPPFRPPFSRLRGSPPRPLSGRRLKGISFCEGGGGKGGLQLSAWRSFVPPAAPVGLARPLPSLFVLCSLPAPGVCALFCK